MIETESNNIRVIGNYMVQDARRMPAAIYNTIHTKGYSDIHLDFTKMDKTHAQSIIPLISQIFYHRKNDIDFSLTLPETEVLARLFQNSNWAYMISPSQYSQSRFRTTKHIPAVVFGTTDEQASVVEQTMETLMASLTGFSRSHLTAIEWSINEIMDNVLVHSNSHFGGIVQVTAMKTKQRVEFIVSDGGLGVAQSLRGAYNNIHSDVDALSKAIQEGVTRDKKVGQGNGLYGTYKVAIESDGSFCMMANNATLYFTNTTGMHSKVETVPLVGSTIICGIDYTNPLILENALRFDKKPHVPVDRIEMKYETQQDGLLHFPIKEEARSLGSRAGGTPVRNKLDNLIGMKGIRAIGVDFSGVEVISSSFADEVFGKLFLLKGPIDFSKIQFQNVSPIIKKLIDKAIMQRINTGDFT